MSKSFWLLLALVFLALASASMQGRSPQASAPAPALTPPPVATPSQPPVQTKNPVKPTAESQAKAKDIYMRDCALCHGDNGNGKSDLATSMELTMDDWTNPATLANKEDWQLFSIIRNGKDKMPPEDPGRATDTEVWNLIIYIRGLSKNQPAPAPAPAH